MTSRSWISMDMQYREMKFPRNVFSMYCAIGFRKTIIAMGVGPRSRVTPVMVGLIDVTPPIPVNGRTILFEAQAIYIIRHVFVRSS